MHQASICKPLSQGVGLPTLAYKIPRARFCFKFVGIGQARVLDLLLAVSPAH